jgi:hypothetical protein
LCLGFLPVALMPLHNWIYGGVVVLTSTNATSSSLLIMPPSAWAAAAGELLTLHPAGDHVQRAVQQIAHALTGPTESLVLIPLHAAAIVPLVWIDVRKGSADPWLRLVAAATLAQHAVALFYPPSPRYYHLTWFATFLVCAVWFETTGLELLRKRRPGLCEGFTRHPAIRSLGRAIAALQRMSGLTQPPP